MSFFPRCFYENSASDNIPAQSHFLGSGGRSGVIDNGDKVLITFGNTFSESARKDLARCILKELQGRNMSCLILTGCDQLTAQLEEDLSGFDGVSIHSWMPYDEAYGCARIAVGHGGTAHVWTGMREGVPLLVIPSMGDQHFGGEQVERLNIGRTIQLNKSSIRAHKILFGFLQHIFQKPAAFGSSDCVHALGEMLDDPDIKRCSLAMSRKMRSGGWVSAGATLLEQLACKSAPIRNCVNGGCCC